MVQPSTGRHPIRTRREPILLSSSDGLMKHAWDTDQEHILKKWKCQLFVHMYMQGEARAYFRMLYNWLSTPVILINTTASAAIFVTNREDVRNYVLLGMTLAAAILATLARSMQVAELYQQHSSVCIRYCSLLHDVENVLNMRVDLRPSASSYIDKVQSDMDNIMSAQAEPPVHIVRAFEKTYGKIAGLFYGEDVVRVVLTNMRTNSYLNDIYMNNMRGCVRPNDGGDMSSQSQVIFDHTSRPKTFLSFVRSFLPNSSNKSYHNHRFLKMTRNTNNNINDDRDLELNDTHVDRRERHINISMDSLRSLRQSVDGRTVAGSLDLQEDVSLAKGSTINMTRIPVTASFISTPPASDETRGDDSLQFTRSTIAFVESNKERNNERNWRKASPSQSGPWDEICLDVSGEPTFRPVGPIVPSSLVSSRLPDENAALTPIPIPSVATLLQENTRHMATCD